MTYNVKHFLPPSTSLSKTSLNISPILFFLFLNCPHSPFGFPLFFCPRAHISIPVGQEPKMHIKLSHLINPNSEKIHFKCCRLLDTQMSILVSLTSPVPYGPLQSISACFLSYLFIQHITAKAPSCFANTVCVPDKKRRISCPRAQSKPGPVHTGFTVLLFVLHVQFNVLATCVLGKMREACVLLID